MKITASGMTILIPTKNAGEIGLRRIATTDDIENVFDILRSRQDMPLEHYSWNKRHKEYMEKIKAGSLSDVALVLKELFLLKLEKGLTFGEKKMLEIAKSLIVSEVSIATRATEDSIEEDIQQIFV